MKRTRDEQKWDIVLDVTTPDNRNVYVPGLALHLEGEVRLDRYKSEAPGAMMQVQGVLPRHRLYVDIDSKYVKVVDQMGLPENRQKAEALKALTRTEKYQMQRFSKFADDQHHGLTEAQFRQFMYWARILVDCNKMRIVEGHDKLPSRDEQLKACDHKKGRVILVGEAFAEPKDKNRPYYQLDERDASDYVEPEAATA